jgi:hypothetical protein
MSLAFLDPITIDAARVALLCMIVAVVVLTSRKIQ